MEHVSKLAEAIANTVSAAQAEDGADLAKRMAVLFKTLHMHSVTKLSLT